MPESQAMPAYIGTKKIYAIPMTVEKYQEETGKLVAIKIGYSGEGYKVQYEDGYTSWSPKEVFEKAYSYISDNRQIIMEKLQEAKKRAGSLQGSREIACVITKIDEALHWLEKVNEVL